MEWLLQKAIENGTDQEVAKAIVTLDAKVSFTFWILFSIIASLQVLNLILATRLDRRLKRLEK